ncbi:ankyrin-2-like isoform X2 [Gordionus sp. m RMFG-2023]|uniref:ankyrin-2-like isoform X2 n=1 Tax=Gordionus sp. m RMFG-2023 TaxID=3053472 RepID=UPI0031FE0D20
MASSKSNNHNLTHMGLSDFSPIEDDFLDEVEDEPIFNPSDLQAIKKRIFWASQNDRLDVLEEILDDPDLCGILNSTIDEDGYTPLHRACYNGHKRIYLLEKGANIRAKTKEGWEPIHCASFWSNYECLNALLNHSPNVDKLNDVFKPVQIYSSCPINLEDKNTNNNEHHQNQIETNEIKIIKTLSSTPIISETNSNRVYTSGDINTILNNKLKSLKIDKNTANYNVPESMSQKIMTGKNSNSLLSNIDEVTIDHIFENHIDPSTFVHLYDQCMVNSLTKGGLTPLHLACQNSASRQTLEILLFHPFININIRTPMGDSAKDIALRRCPKASYLFEMFEPSLTTI